MTYLLYLQDLMMKHYDSYSSGIISEKQYLQKVKLIDQEIDNIEMSTLRDNLVLKVSS